MRPSSTSSFLKFLLGFLTFISVSFAVTFAVNSYTLARDQKNQTAAAVQAMLK